MRYCAAKNSASNEKIKKILIFRLPLNDLDMLHVKGLKNVTIYVFLDSLYCYESKYINGYFKELILSY